MAFLSACAQPPPAGFTISGRPLAVDDVAALEIIAQHRNRARQSQALRGLARVALEGPDFKLNRPQRIAIARPSKLRFEVLGLFDVLAAMLVSDGREFAYFDAGTGEITRGPVTPELLWDLVQLDLEPDEVVGLLLGLPMPSSAMAVSGVWREPDAGLTVAFSEVSESAIGTAPNGEYDAGVEIFRFDATGLLREMRSMDPGWKTRYSASYDAYEDSGGADSPRLFPMRITLHSPRVDTLARFEWKRVMLTEELPDRLFEIPGAAGSGG
jgi:hypothetical protein